MTIMYCKYCGKEISLDSRFCSYCSKELNGESQIESSRLSFYPIWILYIIWFIVNIVALNSHIFPNYNLKRFFIYSFLIPGLWLLAYKLCYRVSKLSFVLYSAWLILNSYYIMAGSSKTWDKYIFIFYRSKGTGILDPINYHFSDFIIYAIVLPIIIYLISRLFTSKMTNR